MDFKSKLNEYCSLIDNRLKELLGSKGCMQQVVFDAMNYSISAGGKRIRPVLLMEFCRVCGGEIEDALDYACALEMIHTYSLIHDDLPCMDNDDMRRGKPSCHIVYGEANALLAGDALLNFAFETMLSAKNNIPADNKIKACLNIANCSGVNGMIGGQAIDLSNEGNSITEEILLRLYRDKTAMLLKAACVSGAILGGGDESKIKSAEEYAMNLGIAFQIVDDILDCTGDSAVLGKPIGSDEKNDKNTYVHFHGIEGANAEAERLTEKAVIALDSFEDNEFLKELSYMLCHRNY